MAEARTVLVTGGFGFVGSCFLRSMVPRHPELMFVNVDALTYAAHPNNLREVEGLANYRFVRSDIADRSGVLAVFEEVAPDVIVHFAAETHVDRSILDPGTFLRANIVGTFNLLEAFREQPRQCQLLFHHVSTDEVYGSLGTEGFFREDSPYDPSSPYSASKAAGNHLVRAYYRTYGVPATVTNGSNNYGPRQFPEKLVPLTILNARDGKPLPVYGEGVNVRDWMHVQDHCEAIWAVMEKGSVGQAYNVGAGNELRNIDLVRSICSLVAEACGKGEEDLQDLITFVPDRPGHDLRYALDTTKVERECGWVPKEPLEAGLRRTIQWYLENEAWVEEIRSGEYLNQMERMDPPSSGGGR